MHAFEKKKKLNVLKKTQIVKTLFQFNTVKICVVTFNSSNIHHHSYHVLENFQCLQHNFKSSQIMKSFNISQFINFIICAISQIFY